MKKYDILDLTKFIGSLLIVILHCCGGKVEFIFPWIRVVVPMFFVISAFLFFRKYERIIDGRDRWLVLKKFIDRNLALYTFWLVVQLPLVVFRRKYFEYGVFNGIITFIKNLIFGSTFTASWYIVALVESVILICLLTKKLKDKWIFVISIILYGFSCICSNYYGLIENSIVVDLINLYPGKAYNSFPAAMIWVVIGKIFAKYETGYSKRISYRGITVGAIGGVVLLFLEHTIIESFGCSVANDCYFSLIPLTMLLFYVIKYLQINIKGSSTLRRYSTIAYCCHGNMLFLSRWILLTLFNVSSIGLLILSTFVGITIVFYGITLLEKHVKVFKYAY